MQVLLYIMMTVVGYQASDMISVMFMSKAWFESWQCHCPFSSRTAQSDINPTMQYFISRPGIYVDTEYCSFPQLMAVWRIKVVGTGHTPKPTHSIYGRRFALILSSPVSGRPVGCTQSIMAVVILSMLDGSAVT